MAGLGEERKLEVNIHIEAELPGTEFRNGVIEPLSETGHDIAVNIE